jgi:Aldehyde dehydrogenase family
MAPFGGAGQSGIGREGGTWSFDFYCDVKNTVYSPRGWRTGGGDAPEEMEAKPMTAISDRRG